MGGGRALSEFRLCSTYNFPFRFVFFCFSRTMNDEHRRWPVSIRNGKRVGGLVGVGGSTNGRRRGWGTNASEKERKREIAPARDVLLHEGAGGHRAIVPRRRRRRGGGPYRGGGRMRCAPPHWRERSPPESVSGGRGVHGTARSDEGRENSPRLNDPGTELPRGVHLPQTRQRSVTSFVQTPRFVNREVRRIQRV
jgi:hypothetical protein